MSELIFLCSGQGDVVRRPQELLNFGIVAVAHNFAIESTISRNMLRSSSTTGAKSSVMRASPPLKFRAPGGGTVAEVVPKGRYKKLVDD